MNWIDEANKQLEKQRANFQESLNSGEASKRGISYNSSKAAKASALSQIKNGKLGPNGAMSKYKKAITRKKWAIALLPFKGKKFTGTEARNYLSKKNWSDCRNLSNIVINTGERVFDSRWNYYILNQKEVNKIIISKPNIKDFETKGNA